MSQWQDGDHTVVAVGFDEVVASYGGRVDVVLPEWTDKCLEEERKGRALETGNPFKIMSFKPAALTLFLEFKILKMQTGETLRFMEIVCTAS